MRERIALSQAGAYFKMQTAKSTNYSASSTLSSLSVAVHALPRRKRRGFRRGSLSPFPSRRGGEGRGGEGTATRRLYLRDIIVVMWSINLCFLGVRNVYSGNLIKERVKIKSAHS